ncbi:Uncharacterised protein [Acinetobacter baumannii]|nr:Uncharacterised protein [Acinetobacter baumannii]
MLKLAGDQFICYIPNRTENNTVTFYGKLMNNFAVI